MNRFGFLVAFVVALVYVAGALLGSAWVVLPIGLAFVVVPLLDRFVGVDTRNPDAAEGERLQRSLYYRTLPLLWVPVQLALVTWSLLLVARGALGPWETVGLTLSLGLVTGSIGNTVAHELGHKPTRLEVTGAHLLLASTSYLHFFIEHNLGHHANVATPKDPATARFGQGFWNFYPATVWRQWLSAWRIEHCLARRRRRRPFGAHNRMLWYAAVAVGLPATLGLLLGWLAVLVFVGQSAVAIALLEAVNYVEHYGLTRRELAPGRFERVGLKHSWNTSRALTNYLLFKLQRHSDHHLHTSRRYPALLHHDESPQLPSSYPLMVILAMAPPLWRRVMDPRVLAWRAAHDPTADSQRGR